MKGLLAIPLLLALAACGSVHEGYKVSNPPAGPNASLTREQEILLQDKITFKDVEEVALGARCTGCHQPGGRRADLTTLEAIFSDPLLLVPGEPVKSEIYIRVAEGSMPESRQGPQPLNPDAIKVLERWILEGANP